MRRMTFLTIFFFFFFFFFFFAFSRISESPNTIFSLFLMKKSMISNRRNKVRVSKNHENLKIEFIHFYVSQSRPESDANLKKCFAHGLWVFRPLFDSCSGHFDAKNTYFDVFFMFFDDFGRSQLLGSVIRGCRGAQEPRKIK